MIQRRRDNRRRTFIFFIVPRNRPTQWYACASGLHASCPTPSARPTRRPRPCAAGRLGCARCPWGSDESASSRSTSQAPAARIRPSRSRSSGSSAPRARSMTPEGYAYVAGGAGREETMRENREAFERWRIVPRMLRDVSSRDTTVDVLGTPHAEPVLPLPDRRPRDGASRRGRRRRAGGCGRGHPVRLLEPGVPPDGGSGAGDGRCPALVPALLEHVRRPRREPRLARGAVRLQRDRAHARHDDARLAHPRPRSRLPPVPPGKGDRAVHERPGVRRRAPGDPPAGVAAGRPHHRARDRDAARPGERIPRRAPREPPLGTGAGGGAALRRDLLEAVALVGEPRLPPRADPAADPAQGDPPSGGRGRGDRARDGRGRGLQPRRTPGRRRDRDDGRAAGRRRGDRRSRARSSSTAACARAPTCSAPSRWARPRSGSAGRTCGVSRSAARTACAK